MTQNTTCSLVATAVIAAGFLLGWCAGAGEVAPARAQDVAAAGIREHTGTSFRESGAGPRIPSATVRERTDHPAFTR